MKSRNPGEPTRFIFMRQISHKHIFVMNIRHYGSRYLLLLLLDDIKGRLEHARIHFMQILSGHRDALVLRGTERHRSVDSVWKPDQRALGSQ